MCEPNLGPTANKETVKSQFWDNHKNVIMGQVLGDTNKLLLKLSAIIELYLCWKASYF